MALSPRTNTLVKSKSASRRDHVLNLLPPLTVVNTEHISMHDRLFSDDPPPKTHADSFPTKVLRHLEPFTFYSAPTKGEVALMKSSKIGKTNQGNQLRKGALNCSQKQKGSDKSSSKTQELRDVHSAARSSTTKKEIKAEHLEYDVTIPTAQDSVHCYDFNERKTGESLKEEEKLTAEVSSGNLNGSLEKQVEPVRDLTANGSHQRNEASGFFLTEQENGFNENCTEDKGTEKQNSTNSKLYSTHSPSNNIAAEKTSNDLMNPNDAKRAGSSPRNGAKITESRDPSSDQANTNDFRESEKETLKEQTERNEAEQAQNKAELNNPANDERKIYEQVKPASQENETAATVESTLNEEHRLKLYEMSGPKIELRTNRGHAQWPPCLSTGALETSGKDQGGRRGTSSAPGNAKPRRRSRGGSAKQQQKSRERKQSA